MDDSVPDDVADHLQGATVPATLATCADNRPHAASLWYRYADGTIEVVTTGQKLANIRSNPLVALSVVSHKDGIPNWEVTVRGTAQVIDDASASRAATRRINAKYGVNADAWADENTLVRIDIGSARLETW
ncbi:MAG: pyridoxamine 5'-phosphate oxidase family protein [Salinirussus sp.]